MENQEQLDIVRHCIKYMSAIIGQIPTSKYNKIYLKAVFSIDIYTISKVSLQLNIILENNDLYLHISNWKLFCEWFISEGNVTIRKSIVDKIESYLNSYHVNMNNVMTEYKDNVYIGGCFKYINLLGVVKQSAFPVLLMSHEYIPTHKVLLLGKNSYFDQNDFLIWKNRADKFIVKLKNGIEKEPYLKVKINVLLSSDISSILFHEACGHFLEADMFSQINSPFSRNDIGHHITSKYVNIHNSCNGIFLGADPFDDEGTDGIDQIIVDHGILENIMVDNYWGKILNTISSGNYRTHTPFACSCVRMTNFRMECSDTTGCMPSNTHDCFILKGINKVIVRDNGDFELHIDEAFNKYSGEIAFDVIYIDNIRSFLSKICGVGNEEMSFTGSCYKGGIDNTGDTLPVTNTAVPVYLQDVNMFFKKSKVLSGIS